MTVSGNGVGSVSSSPAGINCPGTCTTSVDYRSTYTLTAIPADGTLFTGWGGACSGTGACTVAVDHLNTITATFTLKQYVLNISTQGNGTSVITSNPVGIDCRANCTKLLDHGTVVTLTATPLYGSTFVGWGGDCSGTGVCTLTLSSAKSVSATFRNPDGAPYGGHAWAAPGTFQAEDYNTGGQWLAFADYDYRYHSNGYRQQEVIDINQNSLGGWSLISVVENEWAKYTVDAGSGGVFGFQARVANPGLGASLYLLVDGVRVPGSLSIPKTANWSSYETVSLSGIELSAGHHIITIVFSKKSSSGFVGEFDWFRFVSQGTLTASKVGDGTGAISSDVSGITCGNDCSESYDGGTVVTLTATPSTGTTFAGWSGGCSGAGACVVTISESKNVTATFTRNTYALNVTKTGDGAGIVTSDVGGISCGSTCSEMVAFGTTVTLTATANTGTFTGWGGACSGTGTCVIVIDDRNEVTANFVNQYWLNVANDGNGSGQIRSNPQSIVCGSGGFLHIPSKRYITRFRFMALV